MHHWPYHWRECLPLPKLEWPDLTNGLQSDNKPSGKSHELERIGSAKIVQVDEQPKPQTKTDTSDKVTAAPTNKTKETVKVNVDVGSTPTKKIVDVNDSLDHDKSPVSDKKSNDASDKKTEVEQPAPVKEAPAPAPVEAKKTDDKQTPTKDVAKSPVTEPSPAPSRGASVSGARSMYAEAYYSTKIALQLISSKVNEIVPLEMDTTPSNFVVRFASEVN